MLRPVFWLIRWMLVLALAGYTAAVVRIAIKPLESAPGWEALLFNPVVWAFAGGFGGRWLLARLGSGDPLELLDTLEHELTHAIAGWLTFAPPISLKATLRSGGEVELKRTNPVAVLAPYVLPLYAAALAPLTLLLLPDWADIARLGVAVLLGSFAWRLAREFHFGQSDFREYGILFSIVTILALLPMSTSGILWLADLAEIPWGAALELYGNWIAALWTPSGIR